MNSIAFPKMFKSSSTLIKNDYDATLQNFKLLLLCNSGEMEGDPGYGVDTRRYLYDQNTSPLRALLVDEIFAKVKLFMPQLVVDRKDIKIRQQGKRTYITISGLNREDYTTDMYDLVLFQSEER